MPERLPLRILYVVSRPDNVGFIDPRATAKALFDAVDPLGASVRVDFCRPPTLARMEEMLCDGQRAGEPSGLVHFDGHGTFRPETQAGGLCFETPADRFGASVTDFVAAGRLGDLLASYAIPVAILEACRSATVGKTTVFGSVAPRLIEAGVRSVLAMSHGVHVEATRLLLDRFYRELVRGATIGQAVAGARKALRTTPARWLEFGPGARTVALRDWFLPQLYQREGDVLLVWDNFESALPQFNDGAAGHGSPYTDDERRRLAELFQDLTAGAGRGCLLITCRPGDSGLPGAQGYELQGLARPDGLWLLASILRRDGLTLDDPRLSRDQLEPLLRDLADHPLSLELVGPHLRTLAPEEIRADFGKLLAQFQQDAPEARNQSLLASLEFSRRHLSPAAREALPWLGLFRGGVFEENLLAVSQLDPELWEPIRRELEGTALLRTERALAIGGPLFLRFHPTLASSSADPALAQDPAIWQRFLGVYLGVRQALDNGLRSSQARTALRILNREEANYCRAIQWAVALQQLPAAVRLVATFSDCLERLGRLRDHDAWVAQLRVAVGQEDFHGGSRRRRASARLDALHSRRSTRRSGSARGPN